MSFMNAFDAVGLEKDDATVEALRADFAALIRDWIKQNQLTQTAAGNRLGIKQSAVSEIVNGRASRASIEYLIRLLARADVAWTARCWNPPDDAAVCKGAAPAEWTSAVSSVVAAPPLQFDKSSAGLDFWTRHEISADTTSKSGSAPVRRGALHG